MDWRRLWRDQRGQAVTEYVLVLSIVLGLVLVLVRSLIKPAFEMIQGIMVAKLKDILGKSDLHSLSFGR